jgi:hypothetical protein
VAKKLRMPRGAAPKITGLAAIRRREKAAYRTAYTEWFINEVSDKVELTLSRRVRLATEFLKNKVVLNISIPVEKERMRVGKKGQRRYRMVVTKRSKPGEFPRAETAQLMRTIFRTSKTGRGWSEGYVGSPLDYSLRLELKLNRSFLVRTLREELGTVRRILSGPIK